MAPISFSTLTLSVLVLALYVVARTRTWRRLVLLGANLGFIAASLTAPSEALPLAAFLALGYLAAVSLSPRSRGPLVAGAIAALVALFVYLKQYAWLVVLPPLPLAYSVLGLSYMLFRVLHLIVDRVQGSLAAPPSLLDFVNYTCFFPCFVAGPIQRYEQFTASDYGLGIEQPPLARTTIATAASRIVKGMFKCLVVAAGFDMLFVELSQDRLDASHLAAGGPLTILAYGGAASLYTLYLYYNFAGYTDVAVALGRLFGIGLPENFDRPFAARNFLEFWSRWHISLSDWFRTYVYNPLAKAVLKRMRDKRAAPFVSVATFFVTFLVMGLWHGTAAVFLYYGLFLGLGMSGNKLYQVVLLRRLGQRRYRALCESVAYTALCRGMTFAYFALALTCFWLDADRFAALAGALSPIGLLGAFAAVSVAAALVGLALERASGAVAPLGRRIAAIASSRSEHVAIGDAVLAGQILALAALVTLFNGGPEFVYQRF